MKVRVLSCLGAVLVGCGSAPSAPSVGKSDHAIVGGQLVKSCQWPNAVKVSIDLCSGTLVNPKVVVTAGHCVAQGGRSATIAFGEGQNATRSIHATCTQHPGFKADNNGVVNDISVCVLDQAVTDVPITPVLMGCEVNELKVGTTVTLAGYGYTSNGGNNYGTKRTVDVKVNEIDLDGGQISVGDANQGACNGDSGGPAYLKLSDGTWRVFGATSHGVGTPCASATVYTLIHKYVPWIEETTKIDITPCFDADGTWHPGPDCTKFPMNPEVGGGDWAMGCADKTMLSGPSMTCGMQDGGMPMDMGSDGGMMDAGSMDDAGTELDGGVKPDAGQKTDAGSGPSGDGPPHGDPPAAGCTFVAGGAPLTHGALLLLALALFGYRLVRRRE